MDGALPSPGVPAAVSAGTAVRLGLVLGHLPTYLADEHGTFGRAVGAFRAACGTLGADAVVIDGPVTDAAGADAAARRLHEEDVDAVVLCHATFTMGEVTTSLVAAGHRLVHWALDEPRLHGDIPLNGFVSAHLGAGLEQRSTSRPSTWLFGTDDEWFLRRLGEVVSAASVGRALRTASIGLVGGIAPGFDTFAVDHDRLAGSHGTRVATHDFVEAVERGNDRPDHDVAEVAAAMRAAVARGTHVPDADLVANARLSLGLRDLAAAHGHTALAVSDWPECQERLGIHPGAALTWLDEAGVPAACEGDVLGAASMIALRACSGRGAALLDVATIHPPTGTALLWHCGGSPLSLADEHGAAWVLHSTLGRKVDGARQPGAVADLVFAPGPVTVARLDRDGSRLTAFEAEVVVGPGTGFDGTRGWVTDFRIAGTPVDLTHVTDHLVGRAVDHHVVLTPGHHAQRLRAWAAWAGVDDD